MFGSGSYCVVTQNTVVLARVAIIRVELSKLCSDLTFVCGI